MKRLIAILASIVMLLSTCACASGMEIILNDFQLEADGTLLDLSGIDLRMAFAADDAGKAGVRLALDGAGNNLFNGVLALNSEALLLAADGISDVYALKLADVAEMVPAVEAVPSVDIAQLAGLETAFAKFAASAEVSEDGSTVIFSEEAVGDLLYGIADVLDQIPQFVAGMQESGYDSMRAALDDLGVKPSLRLFSAETGDSLSLEATLLLDGAAVLNLPIRAYTAETADPSYTGLGLEASLNALEDGGAYTLLALDGSASTSAETGELLALEGEVYIPEDGSNDGSDAEADTGLYLNATNNDGLFVLRLQDLQGNLYFDLVAGEAEGQSLFGMYIGETESESEIGLVFSPTEDGRTNIVLGFISNGSSVYLSANLAVAEAEGEWLALEGSNAVDVLTLSEEQLNKLSAEGMALAMGLVSGIASASPAISSLLGAM